LRDFHSLQSRGVIQVFVESDELVALFLAQAPCFLKTAINRLRSVWRPTRISSSSSRIEIPFLKSVSFEEPVE
jgi:hypothetical protein